MKNLIIDNRIRKEEYDYLSKYFKVKKLPLSNCVYDEISGHSDIFYCKICDKVICSPNAILKNDSFIEGYKEVKDKYPEDVSYNVCQIGKILIVNKFVDKKIIEYWKTQNKENDIVIVNQGYTRCSIAVTGLNSCITSDYGIYKKLIEKNIDVSLIEKDDIYLLDKNLNLSKMNGFIGGSTFVFDNKFVLFGDINKLKKHNQNVIKNSIKINNLELIDFKNLEIIDYGGAIIY